MKKPKRSEKSALRKRKRKKKRRKRWQNSHGKS